MINIEPFFYWINERHRIWIKRTFGDPWPWTEDKILQEYRFCNVFRELDTVTMWIHKNIRVPFADHPNLWFMLALARQINWPDTLDDILSYTGLPDKWDPEEVRRIMLARQAKGYKVYTGAYMLSGAGAAGHDKPWYTCHHVLDPVWRAGENLGISLVSNVLSFSIENAVKWLTQFDGWAGFLSYEVASDLRWTHYLNEAPDIFTWANPGPGAQRGLNRVFGRALDKPVKREQAVAEMRYLLCLANGWSRDVGKYPHLMEHALMVPLPWKPMVGEHIQESPWFPLEMRDIEHSLCETDKMLRVKNGEGKPRARYAPPSSK